jgi:hypothetical protein
MYQDAITARRKNWKIGKVVSRQEIEYDEGEPQCLAKVLRNNPKAVYLAG